MSISYLIAAYATIRMGHPYPVVEPDSANTYSKGDRVTHNGKTWVSDIDVNSWEPGVYGWSEVT